MTRKVLIQFPFHIRALLTVAKAESETSQRKSGSPIKLKKPWKSDAMCGVQLITIGTVTAPHFR